MAFLSSLETVLRHVRHYRETRSSEAYVQALRKKGVKIGNGVRFFSPRQVHIDVTRPTLVEIGDNVVFTYGCRILTHGYDWFVLRNLYDELISCSGKVVIRNNVFVGIGSLILKGVTIGENSIIGAGSIVTHDIPPNSVVAGVPAKVICTIEEYYRRRKAAYIDEAKEYARSIKAQLGRMPEPRDFAEEFPLFTKAGELRPDIPIRKQLGRSYEGYCRKHRPPYDSFEAFLRDAGVPEN